VTRLPAQFAFASPSAVPVTVRDFVATGVAVEFALNHVPMVGSRLTALTNTGNLPIQGRFSNLVQGQLVSLVHNGITYTYVADYFGGTGNDLVLHWANTRLLAFGENQYGKLGDGSTTSRSAPVPVTDTGVLHGKTVIDIKCGANHSVALCSDGTVATWGNNNEGQLGRPGGASSVPVAVDQTGVLAGKRVVGIASGGYHAFAWCEDGTLVGWGGNGSGNLGDIGVTSTSVPMLIPMTGPIAGRRITSMAAGQVHTLALCTDGTLAGWGYTGDGQVGTGGSGWILKPTLVDRAGILAGKTVVAISAGQFFSLARCSDGTLAAWGNDGSGQLGNGGAGYSSVPVGVDQTGVLAGKSVVAIECGAANSVAWCADGTIAMWGGGSSGSLGNGGTTLSQVPVAVDQTGILAGKTVVGVSSGGGHNLAWSDDGSLASWGYNSAGQLGDGSLTNRTVPVTVVTTSLRVGERFVAATCGDWHGVAIVASPPLPLATTLAATEVATTAAVLNGSVNANGSDTAVSFEYGLTTNYGATAAAVPAALTGSDAASGRASLSGLVENTTYHFRVVATSAGGTVTGDDVTFATPVNLPPVFADYAVGTPFQTATTVAFRKLLAKATDPNGDALTVTAVGPTSAPGGTATLQATGIRYTPPTGFTGADSFPVTITDAGGAVVTGTVTVTVGPAPTGGGLTANQPVLNRLPDGKISLKFQGIPGRTYQIQRSADLTTWATLATVTATASGALTFTDESPPEPSAYYRLALP
jgi:alpha-tubulin suppressor-like RCC1 family protein